MLLDGKVILVTGSSRGIGLSSVRQFLRAGAKVYANARLENSLDFLFEQEESAVHLLKPLYFDIRDTQKLKSAFRLIQKSEGKLDCLVNNAGILEDVTLPMLNSRILKEIFETNVFALFESTALASRIMQKNGKGGSIINIASICGVEGGMRGQTAYSSSKGAVLAFTYTAAKELGSDGIRVNAISPGFIDTDMFRSGPKEIQENLIEGVYLNQRVGQPEEVANLCVFLASDSSSYITGENIRVDGFAHI